MADNKSNTSTWQDRYERLAGDQSLTPAELFELASQAAVSGAMDVKHAIYTRHILNHPAVIPLDRFRVDVYKFDLERRNGNPQSALANLAVLAAETPVADPIARAEYLQAIGQCFYALKDFGQALIIQQRILKDIEQDAFPIDKVLYYLETALQIKIDLTQLDGEFDGCLHRYEQLLTDSRLQEPYRERAITTHKLLLGQILVVSGHSGRAKKIFFETCQLSSVPRYKTIAALLYLTNALRNPETANSPETEEVIAYFTANAAELQPTDISCFQDQYQYLTQALNMQQSPSKKIGVVIIGRVDSTRLEKKMLLPMGESTFIEQIFEKAKQRFKGPIVFATTSNPVDDQLATLAQQHGLRVTRGHVTDILSRYLTAAEEHQLDAIITWDGDDLFIDRECIEKTRLLLAEGVDYVEPRNLPMGTFCYGIGVPALRRVAEVKDDTDTEGWERYFTQLPLFRVSNYEIPPYAELKDVRLTLDYPEDYKLIREVFDYWQKHSKFGALETVAAFLREFPDALQINQGRIAEYKERYQKNFSQIKLKK